MNETIDGFSRALRLRNIKLPLLEKMYYRERRCIRESNNRANVSTYTAKYEGESLYTLYNILYIIFSIII